MAREGNIDDKDGDDSQRGANEYWQECGKGGYGRDERVAQESCAMMHVLRYARRNTHTQKA